MDGVLQFSLCRNILTLQHNHSQINMQRFGMEMVDLVYTMQDKFENATFGAKMEQKFSVHTW